ncbi:N-acetyltransferase [Enterovibrio sp. ZSDZ35]|uniref:N-acetyltransferase n=1 Tax=Enterovibrio qingdaonensis TaxID=2899818 RepID=A0ABT5QG12_9GAMM|nr:N-acetyltransferase [Enterovibrio sp. ZSDZ35]MDD1779921.1 N-acetyltransferase [Enterovibrio sp. ZSDZ35]
MEFKQYETSQLNDIKALFQNTFTDSEGEAEGKMVSELAYEALTTTENQDVYGFVAMDGETLAGSIVFTRLTPANGASAFLLSPVAVATSYQKQGVGSTLINVALDVLKNEGVELVFTYGDPNYYGRVGFQQVSEDVVKAPCKLSFPEGWLGQSLVSDEVSTIEGETGCVAAMNKPEIW